MQSGLITNLAELKALIVQQILNEALEKLPSVVEHIFYHFQLVTENCGQHTEHVLESLLIIDKCFH